MLGNDFDSLFRELYDPAYSVALRILGDRQDAEDAASEALARAVASWRRLKDLDYQRAWVLRVTANVAVDMVRRRRPTTTDPGGETSPMGGADDRIVLAKALRRLPRRQREVLVLRFLADMTEVQVADELRITPGAVKQHARRGLTALRARIKQEISVAF